MKPRSGKQNFDLESFLPYLLNQAAEATSRSFQKVYSEKYGMTRTQWRVLANLGKFGAMTASDICRRSHEEKTKVSRAIASLEVAGMLSRTLDQDDRRSETLSLTVKGNAAYQDLGQSARDYDNALNRHLGAKQASAIRNILQRLLQLNRKSIGKSAHEV